MTDDLIISGGHSILVDKLYDNEKQIQRQTSSKTLKIDDKYMLFACASNKFEKMMNKNVYTYYHIVIDNTDELSVQNKSMYKQYGIWANGILTESISQYGYKMYKLTDLF